MSFESFKPKEKTNTLQSREVSEVKEKTKDELNQLKREINLKQAKAILKAKGITNEQETKDPKKSKERFTNLAPYNFPEGPLSIALFASKFFVHNENIRKDEGSNESTREDLINQQENFNHVENIKRKLTGKSGTDKNFNIPEDLSKIDTFKVDEDCRRTYLGLPQRHNTLAISNYRPKTSKNPDQYYYKFNNFNKQTLLDDYFLIIKNGEKGDDLNLKDSTLKEEILDLKGKMRNPVDGQPDSYILSSAYSYFKYKENVFDPLHGFKVSLGKDEKGSYISYYDSYDMNQYNRAFPGKAYEFYDRIYFDPKTKKVVN